MFKDNPILPEQSNQANGTQQPRVAPRTTPLENQLQTSGKHLTVTNVRTDQDVIAPVITAYLSVHDEMCDITNQVDQLIRDGVAPGKIALICKENYGEQLGQYLNLTGLPVYRNKTVHLPDQPFTKKLLQILRYLYAEQGFPYGNDDLLFELLHYEFFHIPSTDIATLILEVNRRKYGAEPASFRKLLYEKTNTPARDLFAPELHEGLKKLSRIVEILIADAATLTLENLLEKFVQLAGLNSWISQQPDKIFLAHLLAALFDFTRIESCQNFIPGASSSILITDLVHCKDPLLATRFESGTKQDVHLVTTYDNENFDFDYVFIMGLNASPEKNNRVHPVELSTQGTQLCKGGNATDGTPGGDEGLKDLFYRNITRTAKNIFLSYALQVRDKEAAPSRFITEISAHQPLQVIKQILPGEETAKFTHRNLLSTIPEIAQLDDTLIDALLKKFVMSATALNNFLRCPLTFFYQNLLRIPAGRNEAMEFGSAVHHALEKLFCTMQQNKNNIFPSKEEMLAVFKEYLYQRRVHFTKEAFTYRLKYGTEVLGNFYDEYLPTWNKVVSIERNITGVVIKGVPLRGKLDKLEFNGNEINVVDYKTGNVEKAATKLMGPGNNAPNGGDYWRQAVFYKILIDHYVLKNWKVVSTEFDFIEPDQNNVYRKVTMAITPPDVETVQQQIIFAWEKIQAKKFYTGCGKENCHWCNLVKENHVYIALHDLNADDRPD